MRVDTVKSVVKHLVGNCSALFLLSGRLIPDNHAVVTDLAGFRRTGLRLARHEGMSIARTRHRLLPLEAAMKLILRDLTVRVLLLILAFALLGSAAYAQGNSSIE